MPEDGHEMGQGERQAREMGGGEYDCRGRGDEIRKGPLCEMRRQWSAQQLHPFCVVSLSILIGSG